MIRHVVFFGLLVGATGCGLIDRLSPSPAPAAPPDVQTQAAPTVVFQGQTAAALDTTTAAERAAAAAAGTGSEVDLGLMVVALGSPAEQGFWLKSAKIAASGKGRVVAPGGKSVAVNLQPGSGGALLSLAAFRALGLGLTDLPEVRVFAN